MTVSAILTCHNRREKTIACLSSLFEILPNIEIYLVDDASTDGTPDSVKTLFPQVNIIKGNGNLFWSRGMYTAWKEALKKDYDFFLWLNDDVELFPDFWDELYTCYSIMDSHCIISGLIANKSNPAEIIYGGTTQDKILVQESKNPSPIVNMNGNVVLISREIVKKIGIIDPIFHHDLGDVDYGLTALRNGIKIYSTRKAIALGYSNDFCRIRKWNSTIYERFKRLNSPLGSPQSINFYFRKKHFGFFNAFANRMYIIVLNVLPDNIVKLIWGNLYVDKN